MQAFPTLFHRALAISNLPPSFHRRFLIDISDSNMKELGVKEEKGV